MNPYPHDIPPTLGGMNTALRFISRERANDITEFNNLQNTFMRGRKVGKVPSSSTDAAVTDRNGDVNWDTNYLYLYMGAAWRRVALGVW